MTGVPVEDSDDGIQSAFDRREGSSMSFGTPDSCPECGGDVQLAEGFGDTLPYTCTECGNNFGKASE